MIKTMENYISDMFPNVMFGQIADSPDSLVNCSIVKNTINAYYNSDTTSLSLNFFVRDMEYTSVREMMNEVIETMVNTYNVERDGLHIVDTTLLQTLEPQRDMKNRYNQFASFTMILYKKEK